VLHPASTRLVIAGDVAYNNVQRTEPPAPAENDGIAEKNFEKSRPQSSQNHDQSQTARHLKPSTLESIALHGWN
jgi:hypothetical protein